jgi:hypothetical protein
MAWQIFAAQAAMSLFSGISAKNAAKKGGKAAQDAANANASDIRDFGEFNSDQILNAGSINASAIRDVGEINANYIERSTARNIKLYGMQAEEDVRRHFRAEVQTAGDIRARSASSGIQANTGSPLQFLNAQVGEGIRNRRYMVNKHNETLFTMAEDGKDRAYVTRYTADKNAEVVMANAAANAATALAAAELSATQQERSGDTAQAGAKIAGQSAMMQGITGAIGAGVNAWGSGAFTTTAPNFQTGYTASNTWNGSWGNAFVAKGVAR